MGRSSCYLNTWLPPIQQIAGDRNTLSPLSPLSPCTRRSLTSSWSRNWSHRVEEEYRDKSMQSCDLHRCASRIREIISPKSRGFVTRNEPVVSHGGRRTGEGRLNREVASFIATKVTHATKGNQKATIRPVFFFPSRLDALGSSWMMGRSTRNKSSLSAMCRKLASDLCEGSEARDHSVLTNHLLRLGFEGVPGFRRRLCDIENILCCLYPPESPTSHSPHTHHPHSTQLTSVQLESKLKRRHEKGTSYGKRRVVL